LIAHLRVRYENWLQDEREGFRRFGLPERRLQLARKVRTGDLLLVYVSSRVSAFAGIRKAISDGTIRARRPESYDTAFPIELRCQPELTLPKTKWVSFREMAPHLLLVRKDDWRNVVRTSLRLLEPVDGRIIETAIRKACR
jgi:hypothetical protein